MFAVHRLRASDRVFALLPAAPLAFALALSACTGTIESDGTTGLDNKGSPSESVRGTSTGASAGQGGASGQAVLPAAKSVPAPTVDMTPRSGIRRLSAAEYDATVRDLLGDNAGGSTLILPDDSRTPFDNDYTNQTSSKTLVEGVELLAADAAARLLKDTARRDMLVGCKPAGAQDDACLKSFITGLGRRALRRPLTSDEITRFATLGSLGVMANDFTVSVNAVVRFFLQHPEFLNRVEMGVPVAGQVGVYKLSDDEVASRLSYLLWGSMPNAALFEKADRKQLSSVDQVRSAAVDLMTDPRARERIKRFHAMWIGFEDLRQAPSLADAMRAETGALIERVVFDDKRPWQDLFRLDETFVGDALAKHYGITSPGSAAAKWVKWGAASGRKGLLSQGSFLQVGTKANDSSPTLRGLFVRRNLFCQPIAPPPPGVNTDNVAPATATAVCKKDRYAAHDQGGCNACHKQIDPIGFGLEAYDKEGRFRTAEADHPECLISGEGELAGIATFKGPAELGARALEAGLLNACVVEQIHRFATGRSALDELDTALVSRFAERAGKADFRLDAVLFDVVGSPTFQNRRED